MNPVVIGAIVFGALALLALVLVYIAIRIQESRDEFTGGTEREP